MHQFSIFRNFAIQLGRAPGFFIFGPDMTRCSHDVALEQRCEKCTAEGLAGLPKIAGEHAVRVTDVEIEYYPDHPPRTESATMREGQLCHREGITINLFLLPSWSQTEEDVRFAYRLAESTKGRVFFAAGRDLDRFVVWDYLKRRREIVA